MKFKQPLLLLTALFTLLTTPVLRAELDQSESARAAAELGCCDDCNRAIYKIAFTPTGNPCAPVIECRCLITTNTIPDPILNGTTAADYLISYPLSVNNGIYTIIEGPYDSATDCHPNCDNEYVINIPAGSAPIPTENGNNSDFCTNWNGENFISGITWDAQQIRIYYDPSYSPRRWYGYINGSIVTYNFSSNDDDCSGDYSFDTDFPIDLAVDVYCFSDGWAIFIGDYEYTLTSKMYEGGLSPCPNGTTYEGGISFEKQ